MASNILPQYQLIQPLESSVCTKRFFFAKSLFSVPLDLTEIRKIRTIDENINNQLRK